MFYVSLQHTEAQELPLLWLRHRAFRLVDLQLEPVGQEPAHAGHDPFAGAATANVDVAVIGIAAEAEASAGQFLIEIVKHELLKRGESGPPCGVPSSTGRTKPSSVTPALRYARMSLSTRLSATRAATRAIRPS